jgi:hemolysin activation/secretion protein
LKPLSASYTHTLTLGVDHKDLTESTQFGGETIETPISYTPFLLQYAGAQNGRRGTTQFQASLNFAPRIAVLGTTNTEFENKRFLAEASYVYVRGDISRTQVLPQGWSAFVSFAGQLANQALVSSEQFAIGGMTSVRGYLARYGRLFSTPITNRPWGSRSLWRPRSASSARRRSRRRSRARARSTRSATCSCSGVTSGA